MLARARGATPQPENEPQDPQDAAAWLRDHGVTMAAVTLLAVQLLWMATLLARCYFRQDDYFNFDRALASGLTWNYLMQVSAGHMAPLGFALSWVLARLALYSWLLACIVILGLVAAVFFALLRVLRTLFGNRPGILVPLAVYLFCPLALAAVSWWSVAVQTLPLELSLFMAVDAHVRYVRDGRRRHAAAAAGWLLLGLATVQRGALIPLLLFALTSAFFTEGRWLPAAVLTVRRYWRLWVLYGVMVAGYCVLFFSRLTGSTSQPRAPGSGTRVLSFVATLAGTTLVPGTLGGPWRWLAVGGGSAQAAPPAALQQLSWGLALLVVIASCVYRVRAWRAWAILLGWIAAADLVPVIIGRLNAPVVAGLLGLQARYVTDAVSVLALCLGLAFLPVAGAPHGYRFREPAATAASAIRAVAISVRVSSVMLAAAFLAGSFWSLQALEGVVRTQPARSYIATARFAVAHAPSRTVIVDGPTPAFIMDPVFFGPVGGTSYVIGAMTRSQPARDLTWTRSPRGLARNVTIFDAQGRLWPAAVAGLPSGPPPGQRCWSLTGTGIPLPRPAFRWGWTIELDYAGPATTVAVSLGGQPVKASLPAGAHSFYVPVTGSGAQVSVVPLRPSPSLCLTGITVGVWQPVPSSRPVPVAPVAG